MHAAAATIQTALIGSPRAEAIMPSAKAPTKPSEIHPTFFNQFMRQSNMSILFRSLRLMAFIPSGEFPGFGKSAAIS
jgi:hypothetical protein